MVLLMADYEISDHSQSARDKMDRLVEIPFQMDDKVVAL